MHSTYWIFWSTMYLKIGRRSNKSVKQYHTLISTNFSKFLWVFENVCHICFFVFFRILGTTNRKSPQMFIKSEIPLYPFWSYNSSIVMVLHWLSNIRLWAILMKLNTDKRFKIVKSITCCFYFLTSLGRYLCWWSFSSEVRTSI